MQRNNQFLAAQNISPLRGREELAQARKEQRPRKKPAQRTSAEGAEPQRAQPVRQGKALLQAADPEEQEDDNVFEVRLI